MPSSDALAPMAATVVSLVAPPGSPVAAGDVVAIVEAMKMEHEVRAPRDGRVAEVFVVIGETVDAGTPLVRIDGSHAPQPSAVRPAADDQPRDDAVVRPSLVALRERLAFADDGARPAATAKRHALGLRTARENVADLVDAGSFVEYGALAVAAQSRRRDADDLIANTPADGIVTGIGTIDAGLFPDRDTRCVVMAYDATVLAGTQGHRSHRKTDRLLAIAGAERLPVVLFAEGGGGRPGDVDFPIVAGLDVPTFARYAGLVGRAPVIAIVAGRCFAGNAALAGASDLLIAVRGANLGMGGPAMIEGGGLGTFPPDAIGPVDVLDAAGVVDVLCDDEAAAVGVAKRCLGMTRGAVPVLVADDRATLRDALPDSRVRAYDVRPIVAAIADRDSLVELRPRFGAAVLTFLGRIDGRAVGFLVSQSSANGGALDGDAADKAARFYELSESWRLPVVALVDTPGFLVGPDVEATGQVRRAGRLFVAAARLSTPLVAVVLRKAYGLGAMALAGGGFHAASATIAWPTAEFGAMGLEGAVRLGYRRELEAVAEGPERDALFARLLDEQVARGGALNVAASLEIDAVIDPADTRDWIVRRLGAGAATSRFM